MFCAPGIVFSGTEGVRFRFHDLRAQASFRRYRWCRVLFSYFARPNSFSAVPRSSGPVFTFCAPSLIFGGTGASCSFFLSSVLGLIFGGSEGVGSRLHVLRAPTRLRRFRSCLVPFSCFARPGTSSTVLRASNAVIMFCSPGLVFSSTEGVRSRFHVFRSRSFFRSYRGRQVPFSCFALPDSFSVIPRAPLPVFMFSALGHVLGGTDGVGSLFHVLRSRTYFRRYRGRRVRFSRFAFPD
jgi:hypothetical protein